MTEKIAIRVNELITLANKTLASTQHPKGIGLSSVDYELFNQLRSSSLSFIKNLYGKDHPYYTDFDTRVDDARPSNTKFALGILNGIKSEVEGGWLITMKGLISAEIFSDFLEMADYLLKEGYKDPAAVMIGSVLEEHLRQLCLKNSIPILSTKNDKSKKADLLNAELAAENVYNKLDQKNVTAWLDLRNKAAHGKYDEFNHQQVEFVMQAVIEFMTRNEV